MGSEDSKIGKTRIDNSYFDNKLESGVWCLGQNMRSQICFRFEGVCETQQVGGKFLGDIVVNELSVHRIFGFKYIGEIESNI